MVMQRCGFADRLDLYFYFVLNLIQQILRKTFKFFKNESRLLSMFFFIWKKQLILRLVCKSKRIYIIIDIFFFLFFHFKIMNDVFNDFIVQKTWGFIFL